MTLAENKRLYDISTRLQVYTEGVKTQYQREFDSVLSKVKTEFDKLLMNVQYKTLDGMTKAELTSLVRSLRTSQSKVFSTYTQKLLDQLNDFMTADLEVNRRVYAATKFDPEADDLSDSEAIALIIADNKINGYKALFGMAAITEDDSKLWASVTNMPIAANGLYLLPFLKTFSNSAQASIENIVRKGYANGWTVAETIDAVTSTKTKQGTSSQIHRIKIQADAVISTSIQHVSGVVSEALLSSIYNKYVWYSVIDSRTSDICRSRNLNIYDYGVGPIPPAHINCRSHIAPLIGSTAFDAETFYNWARRQPQDVQDDIFNGSIVKASDLEGWRYREPTTLERFKNSVKRILSR